MPVEYATAGWTLTSAQERVADATSNSNVTVSGPPACGKTTALAAFVLRLGEGGKRALVICSHESGVCAFRDALRALRERASVHATASQPEHHIATLSGHAARWMRSAYVAARVSPHVRVGDASATRDILLQAARGLLDMTWPLFSRRQLNLDLPHLSRPEAFLNEAASLFTLLQRARIGPDEFEAGCEAGLAAFYGENVERAVVLLHDPIVRERASQRGRDACRVPATALALQRAAERDVAAILTQLYREYLTAAAQADIRSPEDIVDAAIRWLTHDVQSAKNIMLPFATLVVDDAEDGEPGLGAIASALKNATDCGLVIAGWDAARVDGFEGRRSALALGEAGVRVELAPTNPIPSMLLQRLTDEAEEVAWIAAHIEELLAAGEAPEHIALLCRGEDTALNYARLLRHSGIPVSLPPSAFEDEKELLDLLAVCAVVQDPFQPAYLLRVLSSPLLGFSDATLWTLCRDATASAQLALPVGEPIPSLHTGSGGTTLAENVLYGGADALLPEAQRATLAEFRVQLDVWRKATQGFSPAQLAAYIATAAGFVERWRRAQSHVRERLLEDAQRVFESLSAPKFFNAALGHIADGFQRGMLLIRPAARSAAAVAANSIAGAKGQRWRHVFVAGVAHERFPRIYTSHAIAFSRTYGLIVRENVAKGAAQTAKFAWYYAKFGAKNMYLDEERRALQYGLSRATLSAAASGFGAPPRWARDQDLLATLEAK